MHNSNLFCQNVTTVLFQLVVLSALVGILTTNEPVVSKHFTQGSEISFSRAFLQQRRPDALYHCERQRATKGWLYSILFKAR